MRDKAGKDHTDRQKIADIFAEFYEDLYDQISERGCEDSGDNKIQISPFTLEEVKREVKELQGGKAPDRSGIAAEMLKDGGETLLLA
eukprot:10203969-Karenia_brevis.AAC.1